MQPPEEMRIQYCTCTPAMKQHWYLSHARSRSDYKSGGTDLAHCCLPPELKWAFTVIHELMKWHSWCSTRIQVNLFFRNGRFHHFIFLPRCTSCSRPDTRPDLINLRSAFTVYHRQTSPRSKCKGASPGMVPWLFRLKFSREMGTHPGNPMLGSGDPKMGYQGQKSYNGTFLWNFQTHVADHPWHKGLGQVKSQTLLRCPTAGPIANGRGSLATWAETWQAWEGKCIYVKYGFGSWFGFCSRLWLCSGVDFCNCFGNVLFSM